MEELFTCDNCGCQTPADELRQVHTPDLKDFLFHEELFGTMDVCNDCEYSTLLDKADGI